MTIYKYPVEITGSFIVHMPKGAQVLSVDMQHGQSVMWALVDEEAEPERRRFGIYGTGHPVDEDRLHYYGTFQMAGGSLIWHLFERKMPGDGGKS